MANVRATARLLCGDAYQAEESQPAEVHRGAVRARRAGSAASDRNAIGWRVRAAVSAGDLWPPQCGRVFRGIEWQKDERRAPAESPACLFFAQCRAQYAQDRSHNTVRQGGFWAARAP